MNRPLTALHSIGSLSELDILGLYGASPTQPEKTLMFAVLLDAVECFQKYAGNEADRLFKDTEKWIFKDDPEWPFSFINICEPWIWIRSICESNVFNGIGYHYSYDFFTHRAVTD